ncbi:hypothetical protein ACB092_03G123100 [Castanea dentata]
METASCSILNSLCFSNKNKNIINSRRYCCLYAPRRNPYLVLPFSSTFPIRRRKDFFSPPGKCLHFNHSIAFCSLSSTDSPNPSQELAVLLEVEGVLMDAYRVGNRQAFNVAFQKLGLDCANWSEPVYLDLVRKCSGDEERMLNLYFNRKNALDEFVMSKSSPLRPGVESFIDDAYHEGIPLVIVTAYSKSGDKIARSIIEKLGHERISKVKIVGNEEVKRSFYGQLVTNKGLSSGSDEQIAKEAIKAVSAKKQKVAEDVASVLKLSVEIDTGSSESLGKTVAALRAGAEYAGVPFQNCVLIAGNQTGVAGAEQIGMPCIVLRSSLTSRAEFHSAKAIMDGFGGADLTISKLRQKKWS